MKKSLCIMLFVSVLILFIGCNFKEPYYATTYVYKNECSEDITVKAYCPRIQDGIIVATADSIFAIIEGETHTIVLHSDRIPRSPLDFNWPWAPIRDSTIVVKEGVEIVHRRWLNDPLYNLSYYELVASNKYKNKYEEVYQYIFTDKDFE